jgi:hypothetical protein
MKPVRVLNALLLCCLAWHSIAQANAQAFSFIPGNFYGTQGRDVVSYNPSGGPAGSVTLPGGNELRGLAFGPDGLLYVVSVDGDGVEVRAINGIGQVQQSYKYSAWIGGNISWGKIAFDRDGYFYVGALHGIVRFQIGATQSGGYVPGTDGPFGIYDLDVLPSGNLLVADSYNINEITRDGASVRHFTSLTEIRGVAYDSATNQVYATELGNSGTGYFRTLRYDFTTAEQKGAVSFWYGDDIVLAADGRVIVGSRTQAPGIFDKDLNQSGSFQGGETRFVTQLVSVPEHTVVSDFNGDGSSDLVWQNNVTGDAVCWYMNAALWPGVYEYLDRGEALDWKIAGVGDLNGDKMPDMIWLNRKTGDVFFWLMEGKTILATGYISRGNGPYWKIVSMADLNGDGKPDLLWQNEKTGDVYYWIMDGTLRMQADYVVRAVSLDWRIAGAADLNGDGKPDLVWQNKTSGDVLYWPMNGVQWSGYRAYIARNQPVDWKISSLADYTGDGKPDLVWQNTKSGDVIYWAMNGAQIAGKWAYVAHSVGTQWSIVGPR